MMPDGQTIPEKVKARHRGNLEAFVLRARRVEQHTLAADRKSLMELMRGTIQLTPCPDGTMQIRQELPPEELVESAAARVRPILLKGDDCSFDKALNALKNLCRDVPEEVEWAKSLGKAWRERVGENPQEPGYTTMMADTASGESAELSDRKLALAWIYGDVVHHDRARREEAQPFGLFDRYRAAVPLVAFTMVHSMILLSKIRYLQQQRLIALDPSVFDQEVVLKSTTWTPEARVYQAPVGTPAPAGALADFPDGWTQLGSGQRTATTPRES
jgi:hypothetical protein